MSDSSKRICLDFTKSAKNLPRTENQGLVTTFIDLFRRSMGKDGSASHPESKVRRESFEITLMHTRSYELWTLLDPQDLFRLFFARDEQSLGVGGVLAVVFSEFYSQHSFGFHTFRTIIPRFSLTLTSSTSFGDYLISETKHTKLSQNGKNSRLAGLPLCNLIVQILGDGPGHKIKTRSSALHKYHKSRSKGMHQVQLGPFSVTRQSIETQTDLRINVQHVINMTKQRTIEVSQSQAGRPRWGRPAPDCLRWSQAITTDFWRESSASTRRRCGISGNPRPAGIGEAGRPT